MGIGRRIPRRTSTWSVTWLMLRRSMTAFPVSKRSSSRGVGFRLVAVLGMGLILLAPKTKTRAAATAKVSRVVGRPGPRRLGACLCYPRAAKRRLAPTRGHGKLLRRSFLGAPCHPPCFPEHEPAGVGSLGGGARRGARLTFEAAQAGARRGRARRDDAARLAIDHNLRAPAVA